MSNYRTSVASFVPAIIRARTLASSALIEEPGTAQEEVGVLFADISGFTRLTEQLTQHGPEGAERLTVLLNRYFGTIIDTLELAGGDVLKFAGDALLAVWPVSANQVSLAKLIPRITDMARVLQAALHNYTVTPGVKLSMKLAISAGAIKVQHLGGVFDRWEFLVSGRPLEQLGRANDAAQAGDIVLAMEAASLLDDRFQLRSAAPGVFRIEGADHDAEVVDAYGESSALSDEQTERLLTFLPAAIRGRLAAGYADWLCELRPVSIIFMNLPGFVTNTPLALAQDAMCAMQTALYRFEGSINKISVDDKGASLIAVLGLPPLSHTDDAERAVRAALDIQAALSELGLSSSAGICTGVTFCGVIGNDRRREYTVMGDTVNLSARLMQAANGSILCDAATRRSIGDRLRFRAEAPLRVKGKAAPIEVFSPLAGAVYTQHHRVRFLQGRERERKRLNALLTEAIAWNKQPQARGKTRLKRVCISAEGGLGKWSIVSEMLASAEHQRAEVLIAAGDPLDTLTPFRAWRGVLLSLLGLAGEAAAQSASPQAILERLPNDHARRYAPLLGGVLALPMTDNEHTQGVTGEARRTHTLTLLSDLICHHAALGPTVLAVKDAHLMDPSSWDLLRRIDTGAPNLLIVATVRPVSTPDCASARAWLKQNDTEHLDLGALNDDSLLALAKKRLNAHFIAPELGQLLVERCAGNPLYCEELTATLHESGALTISEGIATLKPDFITRTQMPASLQSLISSRIDRLSANAGLTLKVASVIGRVFAVQLVAHLHPGAPSPRDLAQDLRHLADLELVTQVPFGSRAALGPPPYYQFKNELIRDTTYGLMLYSQRRVLHEKMGAWIETNLSDELASHYALLGRHWALAAEGSEPDPATLQRAATYLERAGDRAAAGYANQEAVGLYRQALALVARLTRDEPSRAELDLLLKLGGPLIATRNYADPDVLSIYGRARHISQTIGEQSAVFSAIRGLWQGAVGRSDYSTASDLAEELVTLAEQSDDTKLALEAHRAVGNSAFWPGDFDRARRSMEFAVQLADVDPHRPLASGFSQDPDIANRGILAWALANLGYVRSASAQIDAALERSNALHHPFSMAYALGSAMWNYFIVRDVQATQDFAGRLIRICSENGFPYLHIAGATASAWTRAERGDADAALEELRRALTAWHRNSGEIGMALFLYVQSEIEALAGQPEQVLKTLIHPILRKRVTVERWFLADIIRLRAECQWAIGEQTDALTSIGEARRIATAQNARIPALRLACFEAQHIGRPQHKAALEAALDALPEHLYTGTIARAEALRDEKNEAVSDRGC